jgi:hypothetical protein
MLATMSGEKCRYTSIRDSELSRLREQEGRLRSIQQDLPDQLNRIRQESQREMQRRLGPLENRIQQQEKEAQNFRSNLKDLEVKTNQRLQQQQQAFSAAVQDTERRQREALQRESHRLDTAMRTGFAQQRSEYLSITREQRQEYTRLIEDQGRRFAAQLESERQERQQGQRILQAQIDQVVQDMQVDKQRKENLAQDLLHDVSKVWKDIHNKYQHDRFAPGRLQHLQKGLEMARSNIEQGMPEASIGTVQQTYLDLSDLRGELHYKESEWQLYYNAALQDLRSLLAEAQASKQVEIETGEGSEAEKHQLDVDYWSNGRLSQYEQDLQGLEKQLIDGESSLTTEEVKALGQNISELESSLSEIVDQARLSIIGSQLRVEIANQVVDTLSSMGYEFKPEDAVFEGEDQRAAFVVKMKNSPGDEVVTIISPDREFGKNRISINTFSTLVDETVTQANSRAIFEALEGSGVEGGEMVCNEHARQEYQDIEQVRQRPSVSVSGQGQSITSVNVGR